MADPTRPQIEQIVQAAELRRWYWTKAEMAAECGRLGLKKTGGKFQLRDRIAHFHDTGETTFPGDIKSKVTSKFDWHSAPLSPQTPLTDSYKNTQNVRQFFKAQVGPDFKFNIAFMAWIKANTDKTLADAVTEFKRMKREMAQPGFKSEIADHNQFNQYTRDFLADNPQMGMNDVRRFWGLKRAQPSADGRHVYAPSDLTLGV